MFKLIAALSILTAPVYAGSLAAPTVFEIYPALATVCMNDGAASVVAATSSDNGTLTGYASFQGFSCRLKVHTGRGGGIRIFSACADVTWDLSGNILSVVPVSSAPAYSITCD